MNNLDICDPITYCTALCGDWSHFAKMNEDPGKRGELPSMGTFATAKGMAKMASMMAMRGQYKGK